MARRLDPKRACGAVALAVMVVAGPAALAETPILDIYKTIHEHPELSHFESETSAVATALLH